MNIESNIIHCAVRMGVRNGQAFRTAVDSQVAQLIRNIPVQVSQSEECIPSKQYNMLLHTCCIHPPNDSGWRPLVAAKGRKDEFFIEFCQ